MTEAAWMLNEPAHRGSFLHKYSFMQFICYPSDLLLYFKTTQEHSGAEAGNRSRVRGMDSMVFWGRAMRMLLWAL